MSVMATSAGMLPPKTRERATGRPNESRIFDTDDVERMWRAVMAALRALGFRIGRVDPGTSIAVTRTREKGRLVRLKVQVIPRGDAQYVVAVEPIAGFCDDPEPVPASFFEMVSQELYLTAHRV